jgi:hypothetical protein
MTRPLTCLTLIAAAGAGLYLYQEKHRAQMMDREINRIVHATEQTRDRIGMMRAEWALLNEPDRLAALAQQHLALQTMTPGQFVQLADLGSRLPAVGAPSLPPPAIEPAAPITAPIALAAPPASKVDMAKLDAAKPVPLPAMPPGAGKPETVKPLQQPMMAQASPRPEITKPAAQPLLTPPGPGTVLPARPSAPLMVQAKPPARPVQMAAAKPREPEPVYHPVYAPVVQAFAAQAPQAIRPPLMRQASAGLPQSSYGNQSYGEPAPFVGSALGMAGRTLAPPVPVGSVPGQ